MHVATTGSISPCCEYEGEYANLSSETMQEAWQSEELSEIRKAFLEGKPLKGCRKCFDREASEGSSMRLDSNARFSTSLDKLSLQPAAPQFPNTLDLRFSNLCNFKCRSCWHGASSKWFSDAKAIGKTIGNRAEISSFESVDSFMAQVAPGLNQLEHIYFAGGEPLLLAEHYALLEKLIALGRTDISLAYNTNMSVTTFKNKSILDLWAHFPKIEVQASVDAVGALGENMRSGFEWSVYVSNVNLVREKCPHIRLKFGITVSAMNIIALPELFDALESECGAQIEDFYLHSLQDPNYYRTQILPKPLKQKAIINLEDYISTLSARQDIDPAVCQSFIDQLQGMIKYMTAKDMKKELRRFIKQTNILDDLRQENSADVMPAFAPYIAKRKNLLKSIFSF